MANDATREGSATPRHLTPADGAARLPGPLGQRYAELLVHGTLVVEYYAPRGHDPQSPHSRDELYVVIAGDGWFVNGPQRQRFAAGDVLFVPAGVVHRFEDFSDNFATWVAFYGPEGGETGRA